MDREDISLPNLNFFSQKDISYCLTTLSQIAKAYVKNYNLKKNSFIGRALTVNFSHFAVDQCVRSNDYFLIPGPSECITLNGRREFR